jgi:hypothetical protein
MYVQINKMAHTDLLSITVRGITPLRERYHRYDSRDGHRLLLCLFLSPALPQPILFYTLHVK